MSIIKNAYEFFFNEILKLNYVIIKEELFQLFREETYGLLREDVNNLTFIDIIKGIFPLDITRFLINNKVKADDRIALSVLFLDYVYDETFKIWEDRCEVQIKKEKAFQISEAKKKSMKSYDSKYKNRLDELTTPLYGRAEGLLAGIYFNKKPLDFTIFGTNNCFNTLSSTEKPYDPDTPTFTLKNAKQPEEIWNNTDYLSPMDRTERNKLKQKYKNMVAEKRPKSEINELIGEDWKKEPEEVKDIFKCESDASIPDMEESYQSDASIPFDPDIPEQLSNSVNDSQELADLLQFENIESNSPIIEELQFDETIIISPDSPQSSDSFFSPTTFPPISTESHFTTPVDTFSQYHPYTSLEFMGNQPSNYLSTQAISNILCFGPPGYPTCGQDASILSNMGYYLNIQPESSTYGFSVYPNSSVSPTPTTTVLNNPYIRPEFNELYGSIGFNNSPGLVIDNPQRNQVMKLTCNQIAELICNQIAKLTCNQITELTCNQIAKLTCNQITELTCNQIVELTCNQIAELTCNQIAELTCNQIAELT
ncbi:20845_t:CDS:2, partial [Rhizophagus irregularis]